MTDIDKIMPVTSVKKHFLELLKIMDEDDATITMTRNGKPVGVLMTPRRYDSIIETIEILSDKRVLASIVKSADDFKQGRVYRDDEVWD